MPTVSPFRVRFALLGIFAMLAVGFGMSPGSAQPGFGPKGPGTGGMKGPGMGGPKGPGTGGPSMAIFGTATGPGMPGGIGFGGAWVRVRRCM